MRARPENAKEDRVRKQRLLVCTLGTAGIPVVPFCCDHSIHTNGEDPPSVYEVPWRTNLGDPRLLFPLPWGEGQGEGQTGIA